MARIDGSDIELTAEGKEFAAADILTSKQLFARAPAAHAPLVRAIVQALAATDGPHAARRVLRRPAAARVLRDGGAAASWTPPSTGGGTRSCTTTTATTTSSRLSRGRRPTCDAGAGGGACAGGASCCYQAVFNGWSASCCYLIGARHWTTTVPPAISFVADGSGGVAIAGHSGRGVPTSAHDDPSCPICPAVLAHDEACRANRRTRRDNFLLLSCRPKDGGTTVDRCVQPAVHNGPSSCVIG